MTQFTTQTNQFLNTNRHIYEVMYLANGANGDIVSTGNRLPVDAAVDALTGEEPHEGEPMMEGEVGEIDKLAAKIAKAEPNVVISR